MLEANIQAVRPTPDDVVVGMWGRKDVCKEGGRDSRAHAKKNSLFPDSDQPHRTSATIRQDRACRSTPPIPPAPPSTQTCASACLSYRTAHRTSATIRHDRACRSTPQFRRPPSTQTCARHGWTTQRHRRPRLCCRGVGRCQSVSTCGGQHRPDRVQAILHREPGSTSVSM